MKVLIISYSQTGQLNELITNCTHLIDDADIDRVEFKPKNEYPFPWTTDSFFDTMPESILETKVELNPIEYKHKAYDLIIFGYQPWFLSPSIPTSSLLQQPDFLDRVKGTPVITIIGSRNMWVNAQMSVSKRIEAAGGQIVGNIPFIDTHNNYISAFTILHWMLSGQKTKKWGIFPKPGVSEKDIDGASVYAGVLRQAIKVNDFSNLQTELHKQGKISLNTGILFVETAGRRIFNIWAKLILKFGASPRKRKLLLKFYKYYLIVALFFIAPIVVSAFRLLILPFVNGRINKRKNYIYSNKFA